MGGVLATFAIVALLLSLVPGPDTLLVLRSGVRGGRRHAVAVALGCAAGSLVWGSAAALGIAALLARSAQAYQVVKLAGAVYLIVLGVGTVRSALRAGGAGLDTGTPAGEARPQSAGAGFGMGLTGDLLNPKMGLFYVAIIPQVVPRSLPVLDGTLLFAGIDTVVAGLYLALLAAAAAWALRWLRRDRVRRAMEGVTGLSMLGLGARIALGRAV